MTPDSFSDGGRYLAKSDAVRHAHRLLREGADVLDVGGESTRPAGKAYGAGFDAVDAMEENRRVVPVVEYLCRELGARVSIDTTKAEVAQAAIEAGASIVNDVSCGRYPKLLAVAAERGAELVLMHNRGRGEVQPPNTTYADVVQDVRAELMEAVERALQAGVPKERIWIDPGLGFGKTAEQSVQLLTGLSALTRTDYRVLAGPSRKSFIAKLVKAADGGEAGPLDRVGGTAAAVVFAVAGGCDAVRVHDVAVMRQAVRTYEALCGERGAA